MGVVFTVRPGDLGGYERRLAAKVRSTLQQALAQAGRVAVDKIRAASRAKVRDFTGAFNAGWTGGGFVGQSAIRVYNAAPHAAPVELGRRPGTRQPPTLALEPWVSRVLRVPPGQVRSVAFLVARAIGRRGIKGRFVVRDVANALDMQVTNVLVTGWSSALEGTR